MAAGDDAAKNMADLDANAGLVDPNEKRRNAARMLGADIIVDPTKENIIELVMEET